MRSGTGFSINRRRAAAQALAAVAVSAGLSWPVLASAEIYGWVDASGVVTYSNLPPPNGAKLTDVIHETPMSPQALADAAHRSEVSALNDRIRLLELEMARSKREAVDYSAPPVAPAGVGCGPDEYADCNPQWGPYYSTGFWYGGFGRGQHDWHAGNHGGNHGGERPSHHWPSSPGPSWSGSSSFAHGTHAAPAHSASAHVAAR